MKLEFSIIHHNKQRWGMKCVVDDTHHVYLVQDHARFPHEAEMICRVILGALASGRATRNSVTLTVQEISNDDKNDGGNAA